MLVVLLPLDVLCSLLVWRRQKGNTACDLIAWLLTIWIVCCAHCCWGIYFLMFHAWTHTPLVIQHYECMIRAQAALAWCRWWSSLLYCVLSCDFLVPFLRVFEYRQFKKHRLKVGGFQIPRQTQQAGMLDSGRVYWLLPRAVLVEVSCTNTHTHTHTHTGRCDVAHYLVCVLCSLLPRALFVDVPCINTHTALYSKLRVYDTRSNSLGLR